MKILRFILLPIVLLPLLSCVKETSRGDAFEASFSLDTDTVYDGDEFGFTVKCNRSQFKVVSFEFPLAPGLLEAGSMCSTRDGRWTLRERVRVLQSQRGRLVLRIEDTETGLEKEFSALYTAYASSGLSLLIENEVIRSKHITAGVPTVIGGDDFVFSLHGKAERLIIRDFECEFNNGILAVGGEISLRDGAASFRIPEVSAEDDFSPRTLSLSLLNPDTGRDTTVTASYVKAARFVPGAALLDSYLIEGEKATLRLSANRSPFHLREYSAPSWFVLKGYQADSPEVNLNMEGYVLMETEPLHFDKNSTGAIQLELYDADYTLRSTIVSVPYTASVKPAPGNISLSSADVKICTDETASITVSTTTAHSTNLFTAKVTSGDSSTIGIYAPSSGESATSDEIAPEQYDSECSITDGRLYLRGREGKWGPVTVRVSSKGNEKVYKDIQVYLRRDVALRLKGAFFDDICWWPDSIDDIFSNLGSGSEGVGWYGMPRSIDAELVSFEKRSTRELTELKKDEVSNWVKSFSLNDGSSSRLAATFVVTVGNKVTSRYFYGSYMSYAEPKSRLIEGTGIDRTESSQRPSGINSTISETGVYGNRISCTNLVRFLKSLDCHADYQHGYGLFTMLRETFHSDDHLGFGSFDVALSQLSYDHDKYKVRWVMTFFEVPGEWGEAAPWWREIGGERPWIIPYND